MNIQEKLTTIADNVPKVYEAGIAEGRVQEQSDFWDIYQDYGNRTNYEYAFYNSTNTPNVGWCDDNFYPKYDLRTNRFVFFYLQVSDIVKRLEECGVKIDFLNSANMDCAFRGCASSTLPTVDATNITTLNWCFYACKAVEINIINLKESCIVTNMMDWCSWLKRLRISGTIGGTFSLEHSKALDKESFYSVINALSPNKSGTITFSKTAVNKAFATTEGGTDGSTSAEWNALVATKPSTWTISVV
jgi:hypothetical protein